MYFPFKYQRDLTTEGACYLWFHSSVARNDNEAFIFPDTGLRFVHPISKLIFTESIIFLAVDNMSP